ncbi:threonine synthase [Fonticella tunisiensis]|uniref:Threonine synthase n=1 Tax=Fonticella tunisiensis TaxID=1096341 RepID=A0A4R7KUC1_9CLOT|nr:threonine synthase [Fonticella tunisiensis]TDT63659.1 threonine synthase [Fonticella tunisiensis]
MAKVKYLQCVKCGKTYSPHEVMYYCPICGIEGTLYVIYEYEKLKDKFTRQALGKNREYSLWRYLDILPVENRPESLNLQVGWTPLYRAVQIQKELGVDCVYVKDDGRNPTASFKDRASAIGVAKAIELKSKVICAASTGNAASSLSGFAACAGISTYIFVPASAPEAKIAQLLIYGSNVVLVDGTYDEAFELCLKASEKFGWYNRSCAINPYLLEGKKTVSFEIMEQLNWEVPDWIVMSIGDGCCISGAWKGFKEMYELGLIDRMPKMLGVQASGSNPVNRAFREGKNYFEYEKPDTLADSISVGIPRNGLKALRALRESYGDVVDVEDYEILEAMKLMARLTGVFGEPAGVTCFAGLRKMIKKNRIKRDEKVVLIVTGNGLKDIKSAISAVEKPIAIKPDINELKKIIK